MDEDSVPARDLAKVVFELPTGDTEAMWAIRVGRNRYRLMNLPLLAMGVGMYDIVATKDRKGRQVVDRVLERSGHSTYRLMFQEGIDLVSAKPAIDRLRKAGCTFERFTARQLGVDVPRAADIFEVYRVLEGEMATGTWWFDEVWVCHQLPGKAPT